MEYVSPYLLQRSFLAFYAVLQCFLAKFDEVEVNQHKTWPDCNAALAIVLDHIYVPVKYLKYFNVKQI